MNNRSNLAKYSNKILHSNQISERLGYAGGHDFDYFGNELLNALLDQVYYAT